jgi:hypothetical protein
MPVTNEKVGIDSNSPQMTMNLSLVIQDDTVSNAGGDKRLKNVIPFTEYPSSDSYSEARKYTFPSNLRMVFANDYSAGASSVTVKVFNSARVRDLNSATNIYSVRGSSLGAKLARPSIVVRSGGEYSVSFALTGAGLLQNVSKNQQLYTEANPMVGREIELPIMACRNTSTFFNFGSNNNVVKLITNSTTSSRGGGSANPTLRSGHRIIENGDVIIDVPVGGLFTTPANNDNPASTLALVIKDALELTGKITNLSKGVDGKGGKRLIDAFDVKIAPENDEVLIVEQTSTLTNRYFAHTYLGTKTNPSLAPVYMLSPNVSTPQMMSAGDKAQTLLGLITNAKVSSSDLLRGIQIPYDSLIQSDAVTPEVRNFFTTYGRNLPAIRKNSVGNARPASESMKPASDRTDGEAVMTGSIGGVCVLGEEQPTFAQTLVDAVTDGLNSGIEELGLDNFLDIISELTSSLADAISGLGSSDTRTGGIRILPENLHLRKEAGKNHYVADLDLIMVHKVAGV